MAPNTLKNHYLITSDQVSQSQSRLTSEDVIALYKDVYASINLRIKDSEMKVEIDRDRKFVEVEEKRRKVVNDEASIELDFYIEAIEEKLKEIEGMTLMGACLAAIDFVQYLCRTAGGEKGGYYFNFLSDREKMEIASTFCRKLTTRY